MKYKLFLAYRGCFVFSAWQRFGPIIDILYGRLISRVGPNPRKLISLCTLLSRLQYCTVYVIPVESSVRKAEDSNWMGHAASCLRHAQQNFETNCLPLGYLSYYGKNTCRYLVKWLQDVRWPTVWFKIPFSIKSKLDYLKSIKFTITLSLIQHIYNFSGTSSLATI